jgi:hypothetical protein
MLGRASATEIPKLKRSRTRQKEARPRNQARRADCCAAGAERTPLRPTSLLLGLDNRPPKARPTSDDSRGGAGDDDGDSGGSGRSVDSRNSRDSLDKRRNSGSSVHRKDSICRSHRQSFR